MFNTNLEDLSWELRNCLCRHLRNRFLPGCDRTEFDNDVAKAIGGNVRAVEKIGFPKQFLVNTWEP